jgi:hypothetical protein
VALFKILKGNKSNLPETKTEGYMYITRDTGDIYVDTESTSIVNNTEGTRIQLNADKAYRLKNSNDELLSAGDETTPVYFENGIPVACDIQHIENSDDASYPILFNLPENQIGLNNNIIINPNGGAIEAKNIYLSESLNAKANITAEGDITGEKVFGAVWNDYAEYRETIEDIEPGRVVCENGDDTLSLSSLRLEHGANIVSDTFGFAIGKTEKNKTPIAVSGRVLAYPWEDRNSFYPGEPVCSGPNGTVSKMSREEIMIYPERIIGTVSAIPEYETWGPENIEVKGRIWIKVR